MKKILFSVFLSLICLLFVNAQSQPSVVSAKNSIENGRNKSTLAYSEQQTGLWQQVSEDDLQKNALISLPNLEEYLVFQLNKTALTELLAKVPAESKEATNGAKELLQDNPVIMELPMPDGTFARFRIEESSVLEPDLAARFPDIKSYRGQGVDDLTLTTRFDLTPQGFHALILSGGETVNVEPTNNQDLSLYISYNGDAIKDKAVDCLVKDFENDKSGISNTDALAVDAPQIAVGGTLRNYRIAMAADFEYTQTYGNNTLSGTIASINTWLNGANVIYEKELSIHLNLVNNTSIIYSADQGFTAASDPYDNSNVGTMLSNAVNDIDAKVGRANYDVGHVFGTAPAGYLGSGVAYIGVVSQNSVYKGGGATQFGVGLLGNSGALGVWVHEIGHQFGANHNFNGSVANCGGSQHSNATSYETGSGSTIMAYSGICSSDNVSTSRDMRFHPMSYAAINNYISANASNFTGTATGNSSPTVGGGGNRYIPRNTPFTLTATGSDPNGDNLTYSWDEIDAGGALYPQNGTDASYEDTSDPTTTTRPIFRSFAPVSSPSRTFPSLTYILNNANDAPNTSPTSGLKTAEELPRVGRLLNFRVTARDNRTGGGGVNEDTVVLTVDNASGPFLVTAPNTSAPLSGGLPTTVVWSVNNTNLPPINATTVKISLSTDGGISFPTVLAANTLNDGNEILTLPNITTTAARIKVEAVGNVFFDISDTNFAINATAIAPTTYEGDISPRPSGDGSVNITDVQQILRFQSGADINYQSNEFQRADCSPRSTSGDGVININDVQQALRYQSGADAPQTAGGSSAAGQLAALFSGFELLGGKLAAPSVNTVVKAVGGSGAGGQTVTVQILVDAQGTETGFGFSLNFNSQLLTFNSAVLGADAQNSFLQVNNNNAANGQIGIGIVRQTPVAAGSNKQILIVTFTIAAGAAQTTPITFGNTPAAESVSDANANPVPATFQDGAVTITRNAPTAASVGVGGRVTTTSGKGIRNVVITMTDGDGQIRTATTASFGYYRFENVAEGETYVFSARSKQYVFSQTSQVLSISDDIGEVNFIATPTAGLRNTN